MIESITALGFPWQTRDPFLFCAYHNDPYPKGAANQGPAESLAGRQLGQDFDPRNSWRMYHGSVVPGFPQHPHRGFETITIVERGYVDHSDSLGATARFGPGDVQWLTAGRGIVHAEMFPLRDSESENPLELFQVWLNLPAANKFADPYFTMLWRDAIPEIRSGGTRVRVVAGEYESAKGPGAPPSSWASQPEAHINIWTIEIGEGERFVLPKTAADCSRTLYLYAGDSLSIDETPIPNQHMISLRSDVDVPLRNAAGSARLLLLEGRPIGEPVAHYGPFVMNTREELEQAFADYRRTGFGGWPWPDDAPVHAPEEGRFALHADGRTERQS
jgi:redox-sensitive bicupin YhaK (pirin superfamily)